MKWPIKKYISQRQGGGDGGEKGFDTECALQESTTIVKDVSASPLPH